MSYRSSIAITTMSALLLAVYVPVARAGVNVIPSLAIGQEYNDNIYLASSGKRSDFISTVSPAISLTRQEERSNASLTLGTNILHYWRTDELDGTDLTGRAALSYRLTPLVSLSLGAGYESDSRPDRVDEHSGLSVSSGSDRYNAQAGLSWQLNERDTLAGSYSYLREEYDWTRLVPYTTHGGNLSFTHEVGFLPATKIGASLQVTRNDVESSTVDNYSAALTLGGSLNETWKFTASLGGRFTDVSYQDNSVDEHENDTGFIGSFTLSRSGERTDGSIALIRDLTTATGRSSVSERTGVNLQLRTRLSTDLSAKMNAGWSHHRADYNQFAPSAIDEDTSHVNGSLIYAINPNLDLSCMYQYKRVHYGLTDLNASQNLVMLGLSARYPLF